MRASMGRNDFGRPQNVWLPAAGVWACLPQSSNAVNASEQDHSPYLIDHGQKLSHDNRDPDRKRQRKPGKDCSSSGYCSRKEACSKQKNTGMDKKAHREDFKFRVSARSNSTGIESVSDAKAGGCSGSSMAAQASMMGRLRSDDEGPSTSQQSTCAICLNNIEEGREAILQWCMHGFCTHCIEEWSRVRRVCPLCKAEYRGWYHSVRLNSEYEERILEPTLGDSTLQRPTSSSHIDSRLRRGRFMRGQERVRGRRPLQPRPQDTSAVNRPQSFGRLVPFPTQRSFDGSRCYEGAQSMRVNEEEAAVRALQWRESIYNKKLKARPVDAGASSGTQSLLQSPDAKARAERRLEPWVRRELQAVLRGSDDDLLVRLVLGLWFAVEHEGISACQRRQRLARHSTSNAAGGIATGDLEVRAEEAIKELERYLGDKAELFWHELRCFAQSPFTMRAYDSVAVYPSHDTARSFSRGEDERSLLQDRTVNLRWRLENTKSRLTVRLLDNQEPGRIENSTQKLRAGRQSNPQSPSAERTQGGSGLHRKDSNGDCCQRSAALLNGDLILDQRKKRQRMVVCPSAEDRWQLSYC